MSQRDPRGIRRRVAILRDRAGSLPLRWQIGTLVALGLIAIFVLFGALGQAIAQDAKQRTVSEWASIATSTARVIDSELEVEYDRLEQIAAALGATTDVTERRRMLDRALDALGPATGRLLLIAPDGTIAWPAPLTAQARDAAADPRILDPLHTGARYASGVAEVAGRIGVVLGVPVRTGDRVTGVLAVVIEPARGVIHDLVASARGLANSGHAELVDQYDRVIVSTDMEDIYGTGEHPDFYLPHLSHHSSGVGLTEPVGPGDPKDEGQRHDMAFVSLRSVPWGLALGGNDAELSADAARWQTETVVLGATSLLVALLLVWLTTRSVAQPVLALAAASRQIAAGDLETPVPQGGEGEVRVLAQAFGHMREKLRNALVELALEKSRYEGIVTSMGDAVVTTDAAGRITAFNPAAAALTGWTAEEALGRPRADVVRTSVATSDAAASPLVAHSGIDRMELVRRDGTRVTVAATGSAIRDREGVTAGTVYVLRDVSAEAEVERMKEEFLATVSHELRTPLGFIMGYATSLLLPDAPDDPATTRRFLRVIADSSKELEDLVDDLLDMAKISSGTLSVAPRPTALAPLVDAAVERARVRSGDHRIVRALPAGLPAIDADAHRLEQVLYDLLDNAIKYSPDGGTIRVTATRADGTVTVSVADQGLGIPPEEIASVFERFHRGRHARAHGIAGTGLGLAICKGIVEAHGGRIWAESPPRDGATPERRGTAIRFTVPVAVSDGADQRPAAAGAAR